MQAKIVGVNVGRRKDRVRGAVLEFAADTDGAI